MGAISEWMRGKFSEVYRDNYKCRADQSTQLMQIQCWSGSGSKTTLLLAKDYICWNDRGLEPSFISYHVELCKLEPCARIPRKNLFLPEASSKSFLVAFFTARLQFRTNKYFFLFKYLTTTSWCFYHLIFDIAFSNWMRSGLKLLKINSSMKNSYLFWSIFKNVSARREKIRWFSSETWK